MLTAAVVGCGPRGREHARALRAIDGIDLVAVADVDPARGAAAGAELGVPAFATVAELLGRAEPALVVLATPASVRLSLAESVLEGRGLRALVLEKPMAPRLAEAHRILSLSEKAGVHLVAGHQLRFCPEFVALHEAVQEGELGRLHSLAGWCYGNLLDQGPHLLDMACWLAEDRKVLWVMSQQCTDPEVLRRFTAGSAPRWDDGAHPAPPWMVHHVAFEDGLRATFETGPLHQRSAVFVDDWLQKRMRVVGSEGWAEAQAAGYFSILRDGAARRELAGTLADYQGATRRFHEELRDVLVRGGRHRCDARDALRSLELVVACAQSAVDGSAATWPLDPERDPFAELRERRGGGGRPAPRASVPASARALEFSVIVTLPEHRGQFDECVRGWVRDQGYPREAYELIVVGNGSEPEVERDARALLGPQDRLLVVPTHNELEMYHRGAEAARGRWLVFTEPHATPEPDCLAELADYFGRTACDGACLRSVGGHNRTTWAHLEERLFREGFAVWSRPGDWRKVILRGFVLRRDVYHAVGGFEYRYERFSEWALAATLHARGVVLGYASGAAVKHTDSPGFADLFPPVANFTRGECAYRDEHPEEYCQRYFGSPPEWSGRRRLRSDVARSTLRAAWRALWRDGWGHGVLGVRFAIAMLREMVGSLPVALLGPRLPVLRARLALLAARLRLSWLTAGEEAKYRAYLRIWQAMVTYVRLEYLASHAEPEAAVAAPAVRFEGGALPDDRLVGFHGRETWEGRSFRWMGAAGTMRLDVPPADYEVCLDTGGVLGGIAGRPVAVFWNGRRVPRAARRCHDGRLSFPVAQEWFVADARQTLTLTCAPVSGLAPAERRRLGLPIFEVTFTPRGAP